MAEAASKGVSCIETMFKHTRFDTFGTGLDTLRYLGCYSFDRLNISTARIVYYNRS